MERRKNRISLPSTTGIRTRCGVLSDCWDALGGMAASAAGSALPATSANVSAKNGPRWRSEDGRRRRRKPPCKNKPDRPSQMNSGLRESPPLLQNPKRYLRLPEIRDSGSPASHKTRTETGISNPHISHRERSSSVGDRFLVDHLSSGPIERGQPEWSGSFLVAGLFLMPTHRIAAIIESGARRVVFILHWARLGPSIVLTWNAPFSDLVE